MQLCFLNIRVHLVLLTDVRIRRIHPPIQDICLGHVYTGCPESNSKASLWTAPSQVTVLF